MSIVENQPKLGQEIYLKPGIRGYGYFSPDSSSEWFRLRSSIWNFASWEYLGIVTDTLSPDIKEGSFKNFLEYQTSSGDYKYLLIDDSLTEGLEFHDAVVSDDSGNVDFEATITKTKAVPFYKRYLGQILAGVLAAGIITVLAIRNRKLKKNTNKPL